MSGIPDFWSLTVGMFIACALAISKKCVLTGMRHLLETTVVWILCTVYAK